MPCLRFADLLRLFSALCLSGLLSCAQAAELGEPVVRSYIGQPLVADIELTSLLNTSAPVSVRLANADVYKGANIAMHPVLASLNMSVMRRDGRQFLHITSVRQVDSENVHLFLDLTEGGRRNVRAVTLWFTPDPTPAPKPPPPPVPAPIAVPVPAPIAAPVHAPPVAQAPQPERPRPARVISVPSSAAACPQPQFSEEQIKSCAAMDYKNGLLSAQIVELEEKVKQLQLAIEGKGDTPPAAAVKKAAPPPPPPKAAAKAAPKEEAGFPWLLTIGIVLGLALVGGAVWFFLSRRKGKSVETAAADSVAWYSRLAGPFRRKAKVVEVVAEAPKDA
jgi:hypothetical protein